MPPTPDVSEQALRNIMAIVPPVRPRSSEPDQTAVLQAGAQRSAAPGNEEGRKQAGKRRRANVV
jgi:hypothetical protein